jgi:hypothetical protein
VELTKIWNNESKALIRTDIVDEMMVIQQTNNGLHHLKFLNEQFFFQFDKIWLTTRKDLLAQIRSTMKSLNASAAALHLKALKNLLEEREFQKDMNIVVSESVAELNSIVGQLNDQPTQEKSGRILTQFGMKFSSQLEQFFLLGNSIFICINSG